MGFICLQSVNNLMGCGMDNRVFNVNGSGSEALLRALELVFDQEGGNTSAKSFVESRAKGLVLIWCKGEGEHDLPGGLTAKQCLPLVENWLEG